MGRMPGRRSSRRGGGRSDFAPVRVESAVGVVELIADPSRPDGRTLLIDGLTHGYVDLRDPEHLELDYVARIGAALDVLVPRGEPADVLHLGGGAFSLPRFLASTRPLVHQTVIERSTAVVKLAERHLRLRRSTQLTVICADGAAGARRLPDHAFDLVLGDAFVGTETPDSLAGAAFADDVTRLLRPGGRYLLNLVDQPPWPVAGAQVRLLRERFAHVLAFGGREVARGRHAGNLLLLASAAPLPRDALTRRIAGGAHPAELVSDALIASWR
jgi:predicted methyltransferase